MKIYADRLNLLANFLDTLPAKRFDFNRWVGEDWKGKPDLSCGTTACGLGWATTMPEFQALGLKLRSDNPLLLSTAIPATQTVFEKYKKDLVGNRHWRIVVETCAEIFGLNEEETIFLFTPNDIFSDAEEDKKLDMNATPQELANHIRKFLLTKM